MLTQFVRKGKKTRSLRRTQQGPWTSSEVHIYGHRDLSRYLCELMSPYQSVGWCSAQLVYFGRWHRCQRATLPWHHQWQQVAAVYLANWAAVYFARSCHNHSHWLGHCTLSLLSLPLQIQISPFLLLPLASHCVPPLQHSVGQARAQVQISVQSTSILPQCKKCLHPPAPTPCCLRSLQLMSEN